MAENKWITLPETNIAPENRPFEKEIYVGNHHFEVLFLLDFREGSYPTGVISPLK